MARALRVISVQRGVDPRGLTLVSFGGAGGLHVCALADALGMTSALVPVHAGVLSALGMLATAPGRRLSRTRLGLLATLPAEEIAAAFAALEQEGRADLVADGVAAEDITAGRAADLRYQGQSYTLEVPWTDPAGTAAEFAARHEARYGHRLDVPVELVNLRVAVRSAPPEVTLDATPTGAPAPPGHHAAIPGIDRPVPVYDRATLPAGQLIAGPAVVTERVATSWVAPGWAARVDAVGNLLLDRGAGNARAPAV
jgi:N-methylhydantoinase A